MEWTVVENGVSEAEEGLEREGLLTEKSGMKRGLEGCTYPYYIYLPMWVPPPVQTGNPYIVM